MIYALIQNDQVVIYPLSIATWRLDNPNISLPAEPTIEQLNEQGIYEVIPVSPPPYDWITQSCSQVDPHKEENFWYQTWEITENTPEQIAINEQTARQQNKDRASQLLQETDWTCTVDITNPQYSNPYLMNQDAFLTYRSQVRQIAVNPPVVVESWPVKPDEVWSNT